MGLTLGSRGMTVTLTILSGTCKVGNAAADQCVCNAAAEYDVSLTFAVQQQALLRV
jgi:hypothetical protein